MTQNGDDDGDDHRDQGHLPGDSVESTPPEVDRWVNRPPGGAALEDRAAALFQRAPAPPSFSEQAQTRVRDRLLAAKRTRKTKRRALAWQWGVVAGLLFGSGAVIAARNVDRWWNTAPAPLPSGGSDQSTQANPPTARRARPAESRLAMETRMLNRAITLLRRQGDAAGSLTELDSYLRRFPRGTLAAEAGTARVDALLVLGRRTEALRALDALPLRDGGRQQELLVIRGELRATADCAGAITDFDQVLAADGSMRAPVELAERALFGRAVCRLRGGLARQAKSDADQYLTRFPQGRFIREARRLANNESMSGSLKSMPQPREAP